MLHHHDDSPDTIPAGQFPPVRHREVQNMKFEPPSYERHIAECAHTHEDDHGTAGEGAGVVLIPLAILAIIALAAAVAAVWPW